MCFAVFVSGCHHLSQMWAGDLSRLLVNHEALGFCVSIALNYFWGWGAHCHCRNQLQCTLRIVVDPRRVATYFLLKSSHVGGILGLRTFC